MKNRVMSFKISEEANGFDRTRDNDSLNSVGSVLTAITRSNVRSQTSSNSCGDIATIIILLQCCYQNCKSST